MTDETSPADGAIYGDAAAALAPGAGRVSLSPDGELALLLEAEVRFQAAAEAESIPAVAPTNENHK